VPGPGPPWLDHRGRRTLRGLVNRRAPRHGLSPGPAVGSRTADSDNRRPGVLTLPLRVGVMVTGRNVASGQACTDRRGRNQRHVSCYAARAMGRSSWPGAGQRTGTRPAVESARPTTRQGPGAVSAQPRLSTDRPAASTTRRTRRTHWPTGKGPGLPVHLRGRREPGAGGGSIPDCTDI
jgi:hypothetical protein